MNYFNSNIDAFRKLYPADAQRIESAHQTSSASPSRQDESEKVCSFEEVLSSRLCLFLGLGKGDSLAELGRKLPHQGTFVAVVDASCEHVAGVFEKHDFRPIIQNPNVSWFVGLDFEALRNVVWQYFVQGIRIVAASNMSRVQAHSPDQAAYYSQAQEIFIQSARSRLASVSSPPEDAFHGLFNIIRNHQRIPEIPAFDSMKGVASNLPGVVVGTGPSLSRVLPLLKKYRDRVILSCVDGALQILLKEGIQPDIVTSLERVPETKRFFEGLSAAENTWLLTTPLLVPETHEIFRGPKAYLLRDLQAGWLVPDAGTHEYGLSSAHMAFYALSFMGCNPIILVGQDHAFDRYSDRSHVEGASPVVMDYDNKVYDDLRMTEPVGGPNWVEGNDGKPILSYGILIDFIHIFERLIWKLGKTCLNAIPVEYGAKISGAQRVDPEEAFSGLPKMTTDVGKLFGDKLHLNPLQVQERRRIIEEKMLVGKNYMENSVIPQLIEILQEISVFYLYHMPLEHQPHLEKEYMEFFRSIEVMESKFIRSHEVIYHALLAPLIWSRQINTSISIGKTLSSRDSFDKKVLPAVETLSSYFREVLSWSIRIHHLFQKQATGTVG